MNIPKIYGTQNTDSLERPTVLADEYVRYHLGAYGLTRPIVYWSIGLNGTECYDAGTHDGMRDGAFSGRPATVFRRYYASLADYLAAGNPCPSNWDIERGKMK